MEKLAVDDNDHAIAQGNLLPVLDRVLKGTNGRPVPLQGLTVTFRMRPQQGCGGPRIERPAEVVDAAAGLVRWSPAAGETDVPGLYVAEFGLVLGGKPLSFPNDSYIQVRIRKAV